MDTHKQSENEISELYDIFQLANEENDKQLIQEILEKFINLKNITSSNLSGYDSDVSDELYQPNLKIGEKEFEKRRKKIKLQKSKFNSGVVKKYINSVSSASEGCITD